MDELEKKIRLFSRKIGSIEDIKPINVLPYLKAATEVYSLAVKLREMAEADNVYGEENILKKLNSILKKLVEETNCAEDEFASWEIPSIKDFFMKEGYEIPKTEEVSMANEDWLNDY